MMPTHRRALPSSAPSSEIFLFCDDRSIFEAVAVSYSSYAGEVYTGGGKGSVAGYAAFCEKGGSFAVVWCAADAGLRVFVRPCYERGCAAGV